MRITIMQPTYLPWLGYFELIAQSRYYVAFDDVQFVKGSWQQKNRIKGPNGEVPLIVPVLTSGKQFQKISEVQVDNSKTWAKKHLRSIEYCYAKAPFASRYLPMLRDIYEGNWERLVDLNLKLLSFFLGELGIVVPVVRSSEMQLSNESRDGHVIDICKQLKADELYDAAGAAPLLDVSVFKAAGINLIFQDYHHPTYHQLHGQFLPKMSTLDLLMNEGPNSLKIIEAAQWEDSAFGVWKP